MLTRIRHEEYPSIKNAVYDAVTRFPLVNAVVSGVQEGQVYADVSRGCVFIATKSGFSLCHAEDHATCRESDLFEFLRRNHEIPNYIHLYAPRPSFAAHITTHWDKHRTRRRAQFRYYRSNVSEDYETLLPPGYRVAAIQEVDFDRLEAAFRLDFGRRYWNSPAEFLANAIGACILTATNEPAAICYSACVVDGIAEMDTLVLPDHRGRRFMRFVSEPFFRFAIAQALVPHWDTFVENTASFVMAQKFGLKPVRQYDLLSVLLR